MTLLAYFASALILVSFMMKDQLKLRLINSVGCAIFVFYSLQKADYPIVFVNVAVISINIMYIIKSKSKK